MIQARILFRMIVSGLLETLSEVIMTSSLMFLLHYTWILICLMILITKMCLTGLRKCHTLHMVGERTN